ncbi:MAG: AMP-binding protein [Acidimicrobiia bacterium]
MPTFADHVRARADDDSIALLAGDDRWTYREWCAEVAARAALWSTMQRDGPPHIGVLLENVPDFTMWLGAAAVSGATIVGINPTRRGAELARDITYTDCQLIVTERSMLPLLEGLDLGAAEGRVLVIDAPEQAAALASYRGVSLPEVDVDAATQFLLLFTSGTSGTPKAVITSHGRLDSVSGAMRMITQLAPDDVAYISMPLFHSNALFTAWAPSLAAGAAVALRRKFSASAFLADVRHYGATYFNYVGKPLAFVLATPEQPDDADNPLRRGYGNEASEHDLLRFQERFGCVLSDGYGQTETGASVVRVSGMPSGALGVPAQPTVVVLDPLTGEECPRAVFDADGKLLNADVATGEIVNLGGGTFEGYWNNDEANRERLRDGAYWSGDLAYRDDAGFFYFAGRSADWMRVDGENFAGAPIERIVMRFPGVVLAAVYGVPDPAVGDCVMAALQLAPGTSFDATAFDDFLAGQPDLGPKWVPSFVRVVEALPMTQTNKVLKRELVRQRWHSPDGGALWWRVTPGAPLVHFTARDAATLRARFDEHRRAQVLA